MERLTASRIPVVRGMMVAQQNNRCAICGLPFGLKAPNDPVLDHDHKTGACRAAVHRGCNSLLGKVENNAKRYGVHNIGAWGAGLGRYLMTHAINITGLLHPLHRTPEEKRIKRNAKARAARANKRKADDSD